MKIRLIVMNGQRIIQREEEGKWQNYKVEKAGAIKPGIYNVYLATPAERRKTYEGVIVHAEDDAVYQQVGRGFRHACSERSRYRTSNRRRLPN